MIPTVVIGGERRIVDEDITPRLNKHGLDVIDVFPMDKEMGDLPRDAEVFFFVTNMMSHRHNDFAKAEAERRGNVKVIYGTSKGSIITQRLIDSGYPEVKNEPAPPPPAEPFVIRISNPKLPGGYYKATVMDGDIDEEKMMLMFHIEYGPEGEKYAGKVYTDVLIRRADYASGKSLDHLSDFLSSIGTELGKTNKGLADMRRNKEKLFGKTTYFQLLPHGSGTRVVYLDAAIWKLKSTNQRRKYPVDPVPVVIPNPTPNVEEIMPATPTLTVVPPLAPVAATPSTPLTWTNPGTTDETRAAYTRLLRHIAENPLTTKEEGANLLGYSVLNGTYDRFWQTARRTLGVYSIRTSPVQIDHKVYRPMCAALGVTPVEWTAKARPVRRAVALPVLPPTPPAPPAPALADLLSAETAAELHAPPAPAPAPAPVAPVAQSTVPSDDLGELREILALLRDEMVKRDIRRMVVTPSGVDFTRVVTVEAKMEF